MNAQNASQPGSPMDPILLEVLWNRLIGVVNEQAAALVRASFTPVVSEAEDLAAALFDARGRMLAQAIRGTPGHINSTANCVKEFLEGFPVQELTMGDVLITNDPWKTSGHLNDLTVVTPIFLHERVVAFFANTCHSVDIGGRPMSAEAKDVYEEGLWLPMTKLYRGGRPNEDLFNIIKCNVRSPQEMLGDLHAQVAGNEVGGRKLIEFMDEFELASLAFLADEILARSEMAVREAIGRWPEGTYENELTSDGFDEPIRIRVRVTVEDGGVVIDYDGTSPESSYGINVVRNYSFAYSIFAIKCMAAPDLPNNEGSFKPIEFRAPRGCILNALHPAPVAARHTLGQLLPSVIFGALADVLPDRVMAEGYDADWIIQPYGQDGQGGRVSFHLVWTGGTGARPNKDGLSTLAFPARSQSIPVEIVEDRSPLVFLRKELRSDSGGPGKFRGGCGQTVQFRIQSRNPFFIGPKCERTLYPAAGLHGGQPGSKGEFYLGTGNRAHPKRDFLLKSGEIVTFKLPGGGGYGDPWEREPDRVLKDVVNGLVSPRSARDDYGVVLVDGPQGLAVDHHETQRLRRGADKRKSV